MNTAKDRYQGMGWCKRRCCLTIVHSLFLIFLWSGQAMAVQSCPTSITASTPTAAFIVNGNGTVTHTKTGLMWKVCSEGQTWGTGPTCTNAATTYIWQAALNQAQTVNGAGFAGKNDWRVPNTKELSSIVETQCFTPSINAAIFPATVSGPYWSSSPVADATSSLFAWIVFFTSGTVNSTGNKAGSVAPVRLVRGGP